MLPLNYSKSSASPSGSVTSVLSVTRVPPLLFRPDDGLLLQNKSDLLCPLLVTPKSLGSSFLRKYQSYIALSVTASSLRTQKVFLSWCLTSSGEHSIMLVGLWHEMMSLSKLFGPDLCCPHACYSSPSVLILIQKKKKSFNRFINTPFLIQRLEFHLSTIQNILESKAKKMLSEMEKNRSHAFLYRRGQVYA